MMVFEKEWVLSTPPADSLPIPVSALQANEVVDIQDLAVYRSSTPFVYNLNIFLYPLQCSALDSDSYSFWPIHN